MTEEPETTPGPDRARQEIAAALREALAGRYDVERAIGRGGMATVYLAHDRRHDRRVALKVLDPSLRASVSADRFLREIRLTAGLMHPHILPLHDSGEAAGQLYYVMPYVEGETLRARLAREGALPVREATRLLRDLADALAYAHGRQVVHRDLKPENVLLAGGHPIIADFGIARALRRARDTATPDGGHDATGTLTEAGISLGTPAYMAPEQAVTGSVDHRADLYALGVIAYEALAGAHPFAARSPQGMVAAHIAEAPPSLAARRSDLPPALAELVTRLLAKDPGERPASAAAVLEALDAMPAAAPGPRVRRGALGVVTAVLLAALAIAWYALGLRPEAPAGGAGSDSPIRRLAVLPFENTSGVTSDDYFSDGLTDELAHALAKLPGLSLAGRTAVYAFKGRHVAPEVIGETLGVDAFISATVRRSGDRLRVIPQLVRTTDGAVLWGEMYESRSGDVFAVQDSLTRAVVVAVAPALGRRGVGTGHAGAAADLAVRRGTADAEAYELYLKAMYHWRERGAGNVQRSIELFQQAIGRDPTFARAYAGLALAHAVLGVYLPDKSDTTTALIEANARRAVTLDSTLADAHIAEAEALMRNGRFADAEARLRTALRLEPANQMAHHALGGLLTGVGRTDEAIEALRVATRLDPLAKSAGTMLAEALIDARRFREAADEARRILVIDSTFPLALFSLGLAQAFGGEPDSAVRTLERGVRLYPTHTGIQARLLFAYGAAGRWADLRRMQASQRQAGGDRSGGVLPAFADLVLGDATPLLRLTATRAGLLRWFDVLRVLFNTPGCNPLADPLLADPGYLAAMRDLGVAACPQARPWPLPPRPGASRRSPGDEDHGSSQLGS